MSLCTLQYQVKGKHKLQPCLQVTSLIFREHHEPAAEQGDSPFAVRRAVLQLEILNAAPVALQVEHSVCQSDL